MNVCKHTSPSLSLQVDVIHINSEPNDNDTVAYGMDLSEYYLNVEWDIIRVPAERHVKKYPCCPEPYPGKKLKNSILKEGHIFCPSTIEQTWTKCPNFKVS